jgi:hypothetical protein
MTLKVNAINSIAGSSDIRVAYPNVVYAPGEIIQVKWIRSMQRIRYNIPNNDGGSRGDIYAQGIFEGGTIIRPLDISIKPKSLDSYIFVEFCVMYEANNDTVFNIVRDGMLVGAAYGNVNDLTYNSRWTGAGISRHDANDSSTPGHICLPWIDRPGTTNTVTYGFAARNSGGSNSEFMLNTNYNSWQNGSDDNEIGVSFAILQEIAA